MTSSSPEPVTCECGDRAECLNCGGCRCHCRCPMCDCCNVCVGGSCCGSYPEYNCAGWCGQRGQSGHYKVKPDGDAHPQESCPDRFCRELCCRPWDRPPAVVLACSASKLRVAAPALYLYTGPLFTSARDWALSVVPAARIWILSARYGLVPADRVLAPYEQEADSAAELAELLRGQPFTLDQLRASHVLLVGGKVYREALSRVVSQVWCLSTMLPHGREHRGIGAQRGWLAQHAGRLP